MSHFQTPLYSAFLTNWPIVLWQASMSSTLPIPTCVRRYSTISIWRAVAWSYIDPLKEQNKLNAQLTYLPLLPKCLLDTAPHLTTVDNWVVVNFNSSKQKKCINYHLSYLSMPTYTCFFLTPPPPSSASLGYRFQSFVKSWLHFF